MKITINDELTLQSLVDGELTVAERNALFSSVAEDDAASWRRIALAYAEEQALRSGMIERIEVAVSPNEASSPQAAEQLADRTSIATPGGQRWAPWQLVSLAATVLLATMFGFLWGHSNGHKAGLVASDGTGVDPDPIAQSGEAGVTLTSFPGNPAAVDPWLTEPWAADIRAQWLHAGYLVDPRPVPVSIKLPGGGTAEVILSDPNVQYVGNAVFQ